MAEARSLLEQINAMPDALAGEGRSLAGRLHVVSSFGFGRIHVAPLIARFADAYPSVRVTLDLSEKPWTESKSADVVIHIGTVRDSSWVAHLLALHVSVEPVAELRDASLSWYVGLNKEGTRIGNALWEGEEIGQAARSSVVGLYRLMFAEQTAVLEKLRGEPVYLIAAMAADKTLRLKPQNLVTGLPLSREAVR